MTHLGRQAPTAAGDTPRGRRPTGGALPPRRESEIQRSILAYLKVVRGVVCWRSNVGAFSGEYQGRTRFVRFGFPGLSDIVGWVSGDVFVNVPAGPLMSRRDPMARFLAIEVKRPGKAPTRDQQAFLDLVNSSGGLAFVATCVQDVADALARARGW